MNEKIALAYETISDILGTGRYMSYDFYINAIPRDTALTLDEIVEIDAMYEADRDEFRQCTYDHPPPYTVHDVRLALCDCAAILRASDDIEICKKYACTLLNVARGYRVERCIIKPLFEILPQAFPFVMPAF